MVKYVERLAVVAACYGAASLLVIRFAEGGDEVRQILRVLTALYYLGFGVKVALKGVE